jgi:Cd2+/Zn2+-exporting ATPase
LESLLLMVESKSEVQFSIQGMDCADCALSLERSLAQIKGVEQVTVNFTTGLLNARGSFEPQEIIRRVEVLGYHAYSPGDKPSIEAGTSTTASSTRQPGFLNYLLSSPQNRLAVVGAVLVLISIPLAFFQSLPFAAGLKTLLQVSAALLAGAPIANHGVRALIYGKQVTIDLLMSIATLGALLIGETGEAATVVLLFAIGEALEGYTAEQARNSLRSLLALKPEQAHVMRACTDCTEHMGAGGYSGGPCPICGEHEITVAVDQVEIGELVIVRPGERIPVDGHVTRGFAGQPGP